MVVYLEETVKARLAEKGATFTYADLVQAVKDGAPLCLRPKVMTVATIVANLSPIMWSHRQGAEVMNPLATLVIGGMISSLLHILIVTPVIFLWLHGLEFRSGSLQSSLEHEGSEEPGRRHDGLRSNAGSRSYIPDALNEGSCSVPR